MGFFHLTYCWSIASCFMSVMPFLLYPSPVYILTHQKLSGLFLLLGRYLAIYPNNHPAYYIPPSARYFFIPDEHGVVYFFFMGIWSLSLTFRSQTCHHQSNWHRQCTCTVVGVVLYLDGYLWIWPWASLMTLTWKLSISHLIFVGLTLIDVWLDLLDLLSCVPLLLLRLFDYCVIHFCRLIRIND